MEFKQIDTEINSPTTEVHYADGYDYITICGRCIWLLQNPFWGPGGLMLRSPKESAGNQYRFINHGLRQLSLFPNTTNDRTIQSIMVLFKSDYTKSDIERIEKYAANLESIVIYVNNVNELIDFLNQRKEKKRLIKACYIYAHGVLNHTSFYYRAVGDNLEQQGLLGVDEIKKIDESIFAYDADVTTYACRNGISISGEDFTGIDDAGQKNSPAQYKANYWQVNVRAMEMRSDYSLTYGSKDEIKAIEKYGEIIKKYTLEQKEYEILLKQYQTEMDTYYLAMEKGKKIERPIKPLPPIKPQNYDLNRERYNSMIKRDENQKNNGGPIMPKRAWHAPTTGTTPLGLQSGLLKYTPKI